MSVGYLQLDYVARPRRPRAAGVLLLLAALATAAALIERRREIDQAIALARPSEHPSALRPAAGGTSRDPKEQELRSAQLVVRQLALPWADMLMAIESAAGDDVAVLQVQPEARERVLRVTAEARDERAMLGYLRRLAESPVLVDAHLSSHQWITEDPRRPLQFTVLAQLRTSS